ncbi:cobalt ABC transporter permease [Methanocaldococcus villosus KIN24-T80]|uniref:Cobalt ABC transporter permease n=1 Tax=Methanocaldococcus villosus KIN24-T80 TaxID=1069083 RepID=N6VUG5_9EURY|nr:cobalt ECF transporter T component CbiQ [Methanocaldococcus villosus]ENN96836.1 cobalt ABC transporter permease [Methanocaldococcus villosus KIN24-T80]
MKYSIDTLAYNNNLKNVNPKLKVLFAILCLITSVISTSIVVPIVIFFVMSYLIIFKAKIPKKIYLYLITPAIGFGIFTLVFMSIWYGTNEIFSIPIFSFKISFHKYGLNLGLLVFSRMLGGVSSMLFLALTTPMPQLFYVLRDLKFPSVFIEMLMMIYRYIFVLLDEMIRIKFAQETRLGYKDLKTSYRSLGILAAQLFIRAFEKGEKAYLYMLSRCYDGKLRTLESIENPKLKDVLLIFIFEFILLILVFITKDIRIF